MHKNVITMLGAIVYWDIHPEVPQVIGGMKRLLSMYIFSLQAWGGTHIGVVGKPCIKHGYRNVEYREFERIEDALNEWYTPKICVLVGKYPEDIKPVNLKNYTHPKDVLYIVGGDYGDIEFEKLKLYKDRCEYVHVGLEDESVPMWSYVILGIALRDKYIKGVN